MRLFILNIVGFGVFLGLVSLLILLYLPDYGRRNNALYILKDKYKAIEKMPSPKLILIGGSNLSFGLNTKEIAKSLEIPAYNMGVHAGLGLKFMLNSLEPYVNKGDIVVVTPEYSQFSRGLYGADELLTVLTDIVPEKRKHLSYHHMWRLFPKLPKIIGRKIFHALLKMLKPSQYKNDKHLSPLYHKKSFNRYGDATQHWTEKSIAIKPSKLEGDLDPAAFVCLNTFVKNIEDKGGKVVLSYPCYHQSSFEKSKTFINSLDSTLQENKIQLINSPKRFSIEDKLCFDTLYHLTKEGVDKRTKLLIQDLKKYIFRG